MNDCANRPRLDAYEDDHLPDPQRAQVEEHLRGCSQCQDELRAIRSLKRFVAEHQVPVCDEQLDRLVRSVELDPRPALLIFFRRTSVAATLMLACGMAAGFYLGSRSHGPAPTSPATGGGDSTPIPIDYRFDPRGADIRQRRAEMARWIVNDLAGERQEAP